MTTWADEYLTLLEDCEKRSERLTDWECGFVDSLQRQIADGRRPTPKQIETLRAEHGIYMTDLARINVAGVRKSEIGRFLEALKAVA